MIDETGKRETLKILPRGGVKNDKRIQLEKLKSSIGEEASEVFGALHAAVEDVEFLRKKAAEDIQAREEEWRRSREENGFSVALEHRKKQAEFEEKLADARRKFEEEKNNKEAELKVREENIQKTETEFSRLKKEVELFEGRTGKAVEDARKQTSQDLKKELDNEKRFLIQKYDAEIKLLQQQIKSMQIALEQRDKDLSLVKEEKDKAADQLRDIAVAVVRGKEKEPTVS